MIECSKCGLPVTEDSVTSTETLLERAHFTNLSIRVEGEWVERQGDFVKHLLTLQLMIEQLEDMNGKERFWSHLKQLPVSKFVGPMREAYDIVKLFPSVRNGRKSG